MPTATPTIAAANPEQFSQWVQSVNLIIQLGAVGVLLLLGFALVMYIWTTRNRKSPTADSQVVITMLSGIVAKQDERQEKSEEANRLLIREMSDHYNEGMTTIAEGMNKQADNTSQLATVLKEINDNNKQQSLGQVAVQADVRQMREYGSIPLQNLIKTADGIKDDTGKIPTILKTINELLEQLKQLPSADCIDLAERVRVVEEILREKAKRATDSQPIVIIPLTPDTPPAASDADGANEKAAA